MNPVQITIPREIPKCPFTQDLVMEAIIGICHHFFERESFLKYIDSGGRNCPLCRKKVEWYAEVPDFRDLLDKVVLVNPIKLEGEHRVKIHQEATSLEEGIVHNLFLIEKAAAAEHSFFGWCLDKDRDATQGIQGRINYDPVGSESQIQALSSQGALLKKLYDSFDYEECETIQEFVNKLLGKELNFFLYNLLLKEAFVHQTHESAQQVMGGEIKTRDFNADQVINDAEYGKKVRAVVGFVITLSLIIGISRKIFRLSSFIKRHNIFMNNQSV
ncbi:MAG: hypothetical protein KFB93_09010 [Simkaniaceae bacterium]|nr:MAG: hypothetical protein KFB93_09010 [Simkaniaceae bacterium]